MKKIFWIFICWLILSMGASAADSSIMAEAQENGTIEFTGEVPDGFKKGLIVRIGDTDIVNGQCFLLPQSGYIAEKEMSPGRYLVSATIQNTFTNTDYDVKCTPGEVYVKENETLEVTVTVLEKGKNSEKETTEKNENRVELESQEEVNAEEASETDVAQKNPWINRITLLMVWVIIFMVAKNLIDHAYNEKFEWVVKIGFAVITVGIVMALLFSFRTADLEQAASDNTDVEIERPEITSSIPETKEELTEEQTESEKQENPSYALELYIGNHILDSVYSGEDTAYGYYGEFGASNAEAYAIWERQKEQDQNEIYGYDMTTGLPVYMSEDSKLYTYSGVTQIFYDQNNHLPDDERNNLRDADGYWLANRNTRPEYEILKNVFEQGKGILNGESEWSAGTVLSDGLVVPDVNFIEKDGKYYVPVSELNGYLPYEVKVTETEIQIMYPGSAAAIKLPAQGEEAYEYLFYGGFGYKKFTMEAEYPFRQNDIWYVEATTFSRIMGIDVKVGDGLMYLSSGEYDFPREVRYIPWSSMDFQDFIDLHSENDSNEILGEE